MKDKLRISVCLLLIFIIAFALMACADDNDKCTVSVNGGTGGGEYTKNDNCTVTSTPEPGQIFVKWIDGEGEDISSSNPYTFKVTKDIELTAVLEDLNLYIVSITGGVITDTNNKTATVYEGQTVSVTAPASQSRIFKNWLINGAETSTANPYVFTAAKNMEIIAVVDEVFLIAVSGGSVGGETRQKFQAGDECTIEAEAAPVGQSFVYWYIIDENNKQVVVSDNVSYTFTVTESEKYYAKFGRIYTVTVIGGYVSGADGEPDTVTVLAGTSCTVKPIIPTGKGFIEWQAEGLSASSSQEYSFDVTQNITIEAIFDDLIYMFDTPLNNTNQMFSRNSNYTILELDRQKEANGTTAKTAFAANVDHVMFYVYTSAGANKDDYVARFIFDMKDGPRLATLDGTTTLALEGTPGNVWIQTLNGYNKNKFFDALELLIGESFSRTQSYYFAAQACGAAGSLYGPSGISDIGPQSFGPY